jgi:hypothetical protein
MNPWLKNYKLKQLNLKITKLIDDESLDKHCMEKIDAYVSSVKDFRKTPNVISKRKVKKKEITRNYKFSS